MNQVWQLEDMADAIGKEDMRACDVLWTVFCNGQAHVFGSLNVMTSLQGPSAVGNSGPIRATALGAGSSVAMATPLDSLGVLQVELGWTRHVRLPAPCPPALS
jgi:hypothetical protein